MICELCGNNQVRSYTHAKSAHHKKKLFALMLEHKKNRFKIYSK